jgi:hypothetical protein
MRILLRGCWFSILFAALLAASACEPALARASGDNASLPLVDRVVDWMGFYDLAGDKRDLLVFCLVVYGAFFGVMTNLALTGRGFGNVLNGVAGVIGICLTLYVCGPKFHFLSAVPDASRFNVVLIACGLGSGLFLVFAAIVKGVIVAFLSRSVDRLGQAPKAQPVKVETLPPRIAAAVRKN